MTQHDESARSTPRPDPDGHLRQVLERLAEAERMLVAATNQLDEVGRQVTPPNPPPPPPWREVLNKLDVVIESCIATSLRARRDVLSIQQRLPTGPSQG